MGLPELLGILFSYLHPRALSLANDWLVLLWLEVAFIFQSSPGGGGSTEVRSPDPCSQTLVRLPPLPCCAFILPLLVSPGSSSLIHPVYIHPAWVCMCTYSGPAFKALSKTVLQKTWKESHGVRAECVGISDWSSRAISRSWFSGSNSSLRRQWFLVLSFHFYVLRTCKQVWMKSSLGFTVAT